VYTRGPRGLLSVVVAVNTYILVKPIEPTYISTTYNDSFTYHGKKKKKKKRKAKKAGMGKKER